MIKSLPRNSIGKQSNQEAGTPPRLVEAIRKHFTLQFDLAANKENSICGGLYLGPESVYGIDALTYDWSKIQIRNVGSFLWLNPPFGNILPFYSKCAEESKKEVPIISICFMDATKAFSIAKKHAGVIHLKGRIKFVGYDNSAGKDCCLHIWHKMWKGHYTVWDWKNDVTL